MRRIITGHDKSGKSIITIDGPPACSIGEDVGGLFEIWNTDGTAIDTTDKIDRANSEILLSPPAGGTKFRYFQINPTPEGVPLEVLQAAAAEAFVGGSTRPTAFRFNTFALSCFDFRPMIPEGR